MASLKLDKPIRIKATGTRVYHSGYDDRGWLTFSTMKGGAWGAGLRYYRDGRPLEPDGPWGELENFEEPSPFAGDEDPVAALANLTAEQKRQDEIAKKAAKELRRKKAKERAERKEAERQAQLKAEQDALAEHYEAVEAWGMF